MNKKLVDGLLATEALVGGVIIGVHEARQQTAVENASDDFNEPEWYKAMDRIAWAGDTVLKGVAWGGIIVLQKVAIYQKYGWELPQKYV